MTHQKATKYYIVKNYSKRSITFTSNTFSIARSVQFNVLGTAKGVRNGDFHGDSDLSVKVADLLEMKQKSTLKADKGLSAAKNIPL